ncbi:hypothetical protein B0H13DRAFT_2305928 [Mycena leptocephala]|nr:hypothetical protein B0H13DRAFT_2305928 [Mycena leptocephala]
MPRVDTAPMRRARRDAHQRASLVGSTPTSTQSISAPVKLQPPSRAIPAFLGSMSASAAPAPAKNWRHPDELQFIRTPGKTWDDLSIIRFLRAHVLSIPPRAISTMEPWVLVRCADGTEVVLPRGYRIPLLWVLKFLWMSVALVLKESDDEEVDRQREWDTVKMDILHVARLCATFVSGARAAKEGGSMDRGWRCASFDRALRRYWHRWLVMRDEFVRDFWREFGEEEYEGDVLKLGWGQWVLKGHKGFALTKEEIANGISAAEYMHGFVFDEAKGTFEWVEDSPKSPQTQLPVPVDTPLPEPVEAQSVPKIQTEMSDPAKRTPTPPPPPTQNARKRKSSAPAAQPPPHKKTASIPVQVQVQVPVTEDKAKPLKKIPPVRVQGRGPAGTANAAAAAELATAPAPVRGSISLAALVSRIPLGGGRHRVLGSGVQVETAASRSRRLSQEQLNADPVDIPAKAKVKPSEGPTKTAQTKRKSVTPTPVVRLVEAGRMSEGMSMFVDSAPAPKEKERIPLPGELRRSESQSRTPPVEGKVVSRGGSQGVEMCDAEMGAAEVEAQVQRNAVGGLQSQTATTKLGYAPFRGHPTDVFKRMLSEEVGSVELDEKQREMDTEGDGDERAKSGDEDQEEDKGKGMEDGPVRQEEAEEEEEEEEEKSESDSDIEEGKGKMQGIEPMLEDYSDLEDLQLLYPESSSPHQARSPSFTFPFAVTESIIALTFPAHGPLSGAHFSSETPTTLLSVGVESMAASTATTYQLAPINAFQLAPASASYQLASTSNSYQLTAPSSASTSYQLSPRRALAELAAEPGLLTRLTQSWGELCAEVGALRAEMRAAPGTVAQLEARVRQLEEGQEAPPMLTSSSPSALQSNAASRWHPLQHLISRDEDEGRDAQMDVDAPSLPVTIVDANVANINSGRTAKYTTSDDGEPLPPRSRKFSSAARLAIV